MTLNKTQTWRVRNAAPSKSRGEEVSRRVRMALRQVSRESDQAHKQAFVVGTCPV